MKKLSEWMPSLSAIAIYLIACTLISSLNAINAVFDYLNTGRDQIWEPIVWELSSVFVMGLLCFPIYRIAGRWPITRQNWRRRLWQHLCAGLGYTLIHISLMVLIRKVVYHLMGSFYDFGDPIKNFAYELSKDLLTYTSISFACYALLFLQHLKQSRIKTLSLESEMASLKLRRLREQLRPHFLFNTLNLISSCMYEDVEKADKLMVDLCALLRHSLNQEDRATIALRDELHFLKLYLEIVNQRFSGRLNTVIEVPDNLGGAELPRFLLQPLAENAIEHGCKKRKGKGTITVTATRVEDRLKLCVCDDGAGLTLSADEALNKGLGLGNNVAMLNQLYPENFTLNLTSPKNGGTRVLIDIPYRTFQEEP